MKLQFTTTMQDELEATVLRDEARRWHERFIRICLLFCIVMFTLRAANAYENHHYGDFIFGGIFAVLLFVLLLPVFRRLIITWRLQRAFRRTPQRYGTEVEMELSAQKLTIKEEDVTNEFAWKKMCGFRNGKYTVLLFTQPQSSVSIPKRVFADSAAADECLRLLAAAGLKEI